MRRLLVTGGEGFIGGRIVQLCGARSYDLKSGQDILDPAALSLACTGVSGIVHCAARISVPESFEYPEEYHRTNVEGTQVVIEAAKQSGATIVFSSSAAVYGEADHPVSELETLQPMSPYAQNKREAEALLENSGVPTVILRYFNVYGPGQSAAYAGVISAFIRAVQTGKDITIYGDGDQVRDFVYVDDVAAANIAAVELGGTGTQIFNIASGTRATITEVAREIIRLTNSSSRIVYAPPRTGDIVYSQADVQKARGVLGWEAKVDLEEGLRRTIALAGE